MSSVKKNIKLSVFNVMKKQNDETFYVGFILKLSFHMPVILTFF